MSAVAKFPGIDQIKRQTKMKAVDTEFLKVEHNVPLPAKRVIKGKYDQVFSQLRPNSAIRCEANEFDKIAQALRKALTSKQFPKLEGCVVKAARRCEDGFARVWAWKEEA